MPIWWVGLVGIVGIACGYLFDIAGLIPAGAFCLGIAVLNLLVAMVRGR
jgi:hypothetical protein